MRRREFLGGLSGAAAWPFAARVLRPGDPTKKRQKIPREAERRSARAVVQRLKAPPPSANDEIALLKHKLNQALDQQAAAAAVLRVIASSPGDLAPVFEAILSKSVRLCEAKFANLLLYENNAFRTTAMHRPPAAWRAARMRDPIIPAVAGSPLGRLVRTKKPVHISDLVDQQTFGNRAIIDLGRVRTYLAVPLLHEGRLIGAIVVYRQEIRPFTGSQIELVTSFAAQAVIAIENARLLKELRQRGGDLAKSLERQTATSEVLGIISNSSGDLVPAFRAMLENATRICDAKFGNFMLYDDGAFRVATMYGAPKAWSNHRKREPAIRPNPDNPLGRMARTKQLQHVADSRKDPAYLNREPSFVPIVDYAGARTLLVVPMLKDNELAGALGIYRQEVRPFTDKQIELVQELRRPGRHRHREHAAAQRAAATHRRSS